MAVAPELKTERLLLKQFGMEHVSSRYIGWLNDRRLMRYSEQRHRKHDYDSAVHYLKGFQNTPNFFWAIEETQGGLGHIGNLNAYIDRNNRIADLGIVIGHDSARGKGYASEAWQAVCDFLFLKADIRKISAGTLQSNGAMLRLMHDAGMVHDGKRKRHYLVDGKEEDVIHMAIFQEDWKKSPGTSKL